MPMSVANTLAPVAFAATGLAVARLVGADLPTGFVGFFLRGDDLDCDLLGFFAMTTHVNGVTHFATSARQCLAPHALKHHHTRNCRPMLPKLQDFQDCFEIDPRFPLNNLALPERHTGPNT